MARLARALRLVVLALAGATPAAADYEYALDDGTGTYNIGPAQFDAQMLWGNYFDTVPGYDVITSISVSFAGSVPLGQPVTVVLFDDPDDDLDPTNAVPVAQATGTTAPAPPNTFLAFDIPDTPVSGGFFVAAMMNLNEGRAAARMDPQSQNGRSWLFFADTIDLHDLGGSPLYYNMADTPFDGTWMVRATAIPEPHAALLALVMACALRSMQAARRRPL